MDAATRLRVAAAARDLDPTDADFFDQLSADTGISATDLREAWRTPGDDGATLRDAVMAVPAAVPVPDQNTVFEAARVRAQEERLVQDARTVGIAMGSATQDATAVVARLVAAVRSRADELVEEVETGDLASLERVVGLVSTLSRIHRAEAEAAQKTVQTSRLVAGEADSVIDVRTGGDDGLLDRLQEAVAAVSRIEQRRSGG